jgi:gamma-glutamylcyclotransferase (GGCT)/AIG2-like uncharacterized protein YtfP
MYHALARYSRYVAEGHVHGELYDLGTYPGLVLQKAYSTLVLGEVYALNSDHASQTWRVLDEYEGCAGHDPEPHEYTRQMVNVSLVGGTEVLAWAYVLKTLPSGAVRVPGGDYIAWVRDKNERKALEKGPGVAL